MLQVLKNWMLPLAMLTGAVFHQFFGKLAPYTSYLIFCMLLLTFCHISPRDLRFRPMHFVLLSIQIFGGLLVYAMLVPFSPLFAQAGLLCVMIPSATAAAVITGMLGGDVAFMAGFVLLSNLGVAISAPIIFSFVGTHSGMPFFTSFFYICTQVLPVLLLPLFCAWGLQYFAPRVHGWLVAKKMVSFYLWGASLTIVMGSAVNFMLAQENPDYLNEVLLSGLALVLCIAQFIIGKSVGGLYHDRISGGQALGQKNTVLGMWLSLMYTLPLASIAPASYVVWHNLFNSWQLWRKRNLK